MGERKLIGLIPELNKEQEAIPVIHVELYGFDHAGPNLQGIDGINNHLRAKLARGKVTLFLEGFGNSTKINPQIEDFIKRMGLNGVYVVEYLAEVYGRRPSEREIREYREIKEYVNKVDVAWETDPETAIKTIIPKDRLQSYFLSKALDKLTQEGELRIEFEAHPKSTLKTLNRLSEDVHAFIDATQNNWLSGRLDDSIKSQMQYLRVALISDQLREGEIVNDLKDIIRKMQKANIGGSLFIPFGAAHGPMLDALKRKFIYRESSESILFENYNSVSLLQPSLQIDTRLRKKELIEDLLVARNLFCIQAHIEIEMTMERQDKRLILAMNYETISDEIANLSASLSLADIRRICEGHLPIGDIMRNNPSLTPFLNSTL